MSLLSDDKAFTIARCDWAELDYKGNLPLLQARLDIALKLGVAEENDDHTDGISAIGAAFRDTCGEVFAISVPIPSSHFAEQRDAVIQAVLRLTADLTQVLTI